MKEKNRDKITNSDGDVCDVLKQNYGEDVNNHFQFLISTRGREHLEQPDGTEQ